jgi:hypothetical protein
MTDQRPTPLHYPYDTRLDVLFAPMQKIALAPLVAAVTHPWYNQTLCRVNDSVIRLGVMRGEYTACLAG